MLPVAALLPAAMAFSALKPGSVVSIAVTRDGRQVVAGFAGGDAVAWDLDQGDIKAVLSADARYLALVDDARTIYTGGDGIAASWDLDTGYRRWRFSVHKPNGRAVAIAASGNTLAMGDADGRVHLWNVKANKEGSSFPTEKCALASLLFTPDGGSLVTACPGVPGVHVFDVLKGEEVQTFAAAAPTSLALSEDGKLLAAGSSGFRGSVLLWEFETGKALPAPVGHLKPIESLAFRPDGKQLATASDEGTVKIWDLANQRLLRTIKTKGKALIVSYTKDGAGLLIGAEDGAVRLWDADGGKLRRLFEKPPPEEAPESDDDDDD